MIDDKTIDAQNAKYWCIFMDKDIASLLDDAQKYNKNDGARLQKIASLALNNNKKKNESVNEGIWDVAQAAHQAAFPLATGNPYQPNFRAMDTSSGVPSLQDQGKNNVIAAATSAALVGATCVPGGWAALGSALASAAGVTGTWLASIGGAIVSIGAPALMAIAGGIVTVSSYLYPRIAQLMKHLFKTDVIAKCEFEADGQPYRAEFSLSTKRWQLMYTNNRWIRTGVNVPTDQVKSLFDSEFFSRFLNQCKRYLDAIYLDPAKVKQLDVLAEMSDSKSKRTLKKVLNSKDVIYSYMLKGTYVTD